jgi:hypothetical protein
MGAGFAVPQAPILQMQLDAVAVTPWLGRDGFDVVRRGGLGQALQSLHQDGALGRELIFVGRVLVMAAAAAAECIAAGVHALGCRLQHLQGAGMDQPRLFAFRGGADALSRQHKRGKDYAAVQARQPVAAINQLLYCYFEIPSDVVAPVSSTM